MNTASSIAQNARDNAKETAKDAREGVHEIGDAAAAASGTIESDLQTLRDDFARLAEQVGDILAGKGNAAWQRAKATVDEAVADAQGKGREAADAVREVSDNFVDAVDESLKTRPYTTLAIVAGLGFLFGAMWRR
ncbi:MAG: hypothetical protein WAL80_18535 [Xanthobacteraceae bacterium]|jgi:ElaB/YqjD/DUF883 family membrane-anchored ribosome-binding protein